MHTLLRKEVFFTIRRRYRRRLSREGVVVVGIIIFVLVIIIFPALFAKKQPADSPEDLVPEIEFSITSMKGGSDEVCVWLDGTLKDMPLDEYVVGVVAAEMPASFESEALKAQAVAARTYTLYKKNHGGCSAHSGADICSDSTHCQAYMTADEMAAAWGADTKTNLEKIMSAVQETSGEMIYYEGEQIQVFFHASSGGRTENSENVYSKALPYLVSVESSGEENSSHYYGEVTVSRDDFIRRMKAFSASISFDKQKLIGDIVRFESGRVQSIEVGNETFTGREIREIFGLNSTNFTINADQDITFSTIGFGHGVGMSQTGANAMAKEGYNYIDILMHYFRGVTVQ